EGGAGGTVSPLGEGVNYYNYNGAFYVGRDHGIDDPVFKNNFANEVRTFADPTNYPIYFHCTIGRDRTGTLALVINGLLGVSKSDLFLDYELSLFSSYGSAISDTNYTELMALLTSTYDYIQSFAPTGTFAEATENYLLSIGITQTEINAIRSLMLE
ncbi:MAG: tyrosine-protein phosphatase, partial [Clostridia bacterium]|nr:tyrosine-protein phosphatase [Clostridia bacterium]